MARTNLAATRAKPTCRSSSRCTGCGVRRSPRVRARHPPLGGGDIAAFRSMGFDPCSEPGTQRLLLVADETGLPAVAGILASLPRDGYWRSRRHG